MHTLPKLSETIGKTDASDKAFILKEFNIPREPSGTLSPLQPIFLLVNYVCNSY
jgi:hypothetical protein